ncbi:hypothetical protein [Amycolatopsis samaneae]|uniref:Excreted virulence factor EspC, type VII ESX diderm n=1 Tax=Amycolatopsis samaneae TaxID=664691 RepID=A0ABW5G718_9PSEU
MSELGTKPPFDVRGFAVAPELANDAYAKISALQDVVGEMVREAKVLGRTIPLGGGYATEVGRFMAEYGIGGKGSAVQSLTAFGKELENLKNRMAEALGRYQRQDEAAADGVDCVGG